MNIALVTLHVRRSAQAVPLAAGCLAAALPEELRRQARLVDLFPDQTPEAMETAILATNPAVVGFSLYSWSRVASLTLARRLRHSQRNVFLVAGGPEATTDPQGILEEGELDAVIRGEGESTFRELMLQLAQGRPPEAVPGLTLRTGSGVAAGTDRPTEPLDSRPSPWLSGILDPTPEGGALWEICRGCTFACDYCFDSRGSRGLQHLSTSRMAAELDYLVRRQVSQIWVLDSTFNFPPERGKALLRLIAEKAPHIHFHLEAKADFIDRETARLLGRLPVSVQLGLQSARPEVLLNIHRNLNLESFRSKIHLLEAEGVTYGLDLIYGLPGDDHQGFRCSLDIALRLRPNHLDIFPLAVLPGTALHARREDFQLRAETSPPYRILSSASWSVADLAASRRLAAAANLFYNVGRAVGFLPALLQATGRDPVGFLEEFADWAETEGGVSPERFLTEEWRPQTVLPLQEAFAGYLLQRAGRSDLVAAAADLIRYHFHHAEALLGPETAPSPPETLRGLDFWNSPWRVAPAIRLVKFNYEVLDLLEMGEIDLEHFAGLFRPICSTALFLRRHGQVFCESLEEDFLKLLLGCDGRRSPKEIFAGSISQQEGEEIVEFAVAEGFLLPAKPFNAKAQGGKTRRKG